MLHRSISLLAYAPARIRYSHVDFDKVLFTLYIADTRIYHIDCIDIVAVTVAHTFVSTSPIVSRFKAPAR